jgi:hypothetical protein
MSVPPPGPFGDARTQIAGVGVFGTPKSDPTELGFPGTAIPDAVIRLVREKHRKYLRLSRMNASIYYSTRTVAALCSALLPFTVGAHPTVATILAIVVAITVALDSVFIPRDRWQLYSKATDLLAIAEFKVIGQYEQYKELLDIITATEDTKLARLVDLKDVLEKVGPDKVKKTTVS